VILFDKMLDNRTQKAAIIAAVAPPSSIALLLMIYILVAGIAYDGELSIGMTLFMPFMIFIVGWIISIALCFLVGVPVHLALHRLKLTSVFWYIGVASALTVAAALHIIDYPDFHTKDNFVLFFAGCFAFGGPVAATTFWWIARPDQRMREQNLLQSGSVE
jgi:hypothetical protein